MDHAEFMVARDARRMIMVIGILTAVLMLVGLVLYGIDMQWLIFCLGVIMTAGTHTVKLLWLKATVNKVAGLDAKKAANAVQAQYLLRFFLMIAVLAVAGVLSQIEAIGVPIILGAALGLMTLPIAGYSMHFFIKRDARLEAENTQRQG